MGRGFENGDGWEDGRYKGCEPTDNHHPYTYMKSCSSDLIRTQRGGTSAGNENGRPAANWLQASKRRLNSSLQALWNSRPAGDNHVSEGRDPAKGLQRSTATTA
jgi:hypothetical protein